MFIISLSEPKNWKTMLGKGIYGLWGIDIEFGKCIFYIRREMKMKKTSWMNETSCTINQALCNLENESIDTCILSSDIAPSLGWKN